MLTVKAVFKHEAQQINVELFCLIFLQQAQPTAWNPASCNHGYLVNSVLSQTFDTKAASSHSGICES